MTTTSTWRLQRDKRPTGDHYWTLIRGSRSERTSVSLGRMPESDARRCLETAVELDERVRGTAREDVLVRYAAIHREGFRELLMDPDREELLDALGAVSEDPGRWSLRRYLDEVFWPERKGTVAESTQKKEKLVWNQLLESPLAPRRIKSLDALSFERYLDSLRRRRLSGRTQALHRATYKALLDFAFRRGHVEKAWNTITPELCVGWVRHCGYAAQST